MTEPLLVAAHPDDETIGASTMLGSVVAIVHVTDGAPRDMTDALRHGFATREKYAKARRAEFVDALRSAGVSPRCITFGVADQEASFCIPAIADRLRGIINDLRPGCILTHAYEGGHPDHDACAVAVHRAAGSVSVWEFAGYHMGPEGIRTGEFIMSDSEVTTVVLDRKQRERKRRMFGSYWTQREVLQYFTVSHERFRRAPQYDFTRAPHEGTLFYEQFPWGMTSERFRELAAEA